MGSLNGGVVSVGPWGGPGGDYWNFKANSGITEIIIHGKDNIKSISFKDASGNISGTLGGRNLDVNQRGEEKKIIEIRWPSEYLKSISGTCGNYDNVFVITSLSFITNLTTYGPYGTTTSGGEKCSIPMADSVVVGFHGRACKYLDALGIFVVPDPVQTYETISFGPWGARSVGDAFNFRVQGSWIKEIIVSEGIIVNSIAFKDANGRSYGKFGGQYPNDIGVEKSTKVEIHGNLEHLTSISGTYGNYKGLQVISSLSFITNVATHGPYGTDSGTFFEIPIQGSLVTGFHGRAGHYFYAIGIHVKPENTI